MKKLLPLLFPLVLVAGCYMPPYQEELSLAMITADKLEGRTVIGPLDCGPWDFQNMDVCFYPSKDDLNAGSEFIGGFVVGVGEYSARIMYVGHSGLPDDEYYIDDSKRMEFVDNSDPNLFNHSFFNVKDSIPGISEYLGLVRFDFRDGTREYLVIDDTLGLVSGTDPPVDLNDGLKLLGISVFPDSVLGYDLIHTLRVDPGTGLFSEQVYLTDTSFGYQWESDSRLNFTLSGELPADLRGAFYFSSPASLSPTRRSYLSVYDLVRRSYRNFSWDDDLQLKVLGDMKGRRIDLLLSNGWLFGRDGNSGYVYDSNGRLLNDFVLGGLNLVYEIIIDGKAQVIFTIASWAPQEVGLDGHDGDDRLYCVIYRLPTSRLDDL